MISWRKWAQRGAGELLQGLIRLKANSGTVWKELLTSTLIAAAEYLATDLAAEGLMSDEDGPQPLQ